MAARFEGIDGLVCPKSLMWQEKVEGNTSYNIHIKSFVDKKKDYIKPILKRQKRIICSRVSY
jgi:hypothetical protein